MGINCHSSILPCHGSKNLYPALGLNLFSVWLRSIAEDEFVNLQSTQVIGIEKEIVNPIQGNRIQI